LLLSLPPFAHCADSSAAFFWSAADCFAAAASAFFALPAAFLVFSPAAFLPAMSVARSEDQLWVFSRISGVRQGDWYGRW